ncbi:MAG: DNA translocase FtsK [Acidobacteria bacterium]|nr:DNA translocase FtsK [Acidobacteriota bacterium]
MGAVSTRASSASRRVSEAAGLALFTLALIWLMGLASHNVHDPAWLLNLPSAPQDTSNLVGPFGAFLSGWTFQFFGYGAWLLPLSMAVAAWHFFWCRPLAAGYTRLLGGALLLVCSSAFLSLTFDRLSSAVSCGALAAADVAAWNTLGCSVSSLMSAYLNRTGSVIVLLALMGVAIVVSTQFSLGDAAEQMGSGVSGGIRALWLRLQQWHAARQQKAASQKSRPGPSTGTVPATGDAPATRSLRGIAGAVAGAADSASARTPSVVVPAKPETVPTTQKLPLPEPGPATERRAGGFMLPPLTLLDNARAETKIDERELLESARHLAEKCREFSVEGSVVQIHPGPVVTTFEFKPDAGVRFSKVTSLSDDLCLAMQAESVLIDRIPGKSTVGIQIPNPNREAISLRELLESDTYTKSPSKLSVVLGKTIHGEPYVADLATMPHLLIAGSTGMGKSVGLNAMLASILFRATPDDVRLIMVDPKRLELGMYEEIPHLLTPVVVEPKKAANALRWAVREMEERYKTLAAVGVRNIEQYNRNIRAQMADAGADAESQPRPLPFIVVVVDELADLMMVAGNEVEESICRLAQMARAVGIHLILATQRPSVDVITGLIKANLPSRISFKVMSKIDSRTILDSNGAEQLLGKGDMLFLPPASSRYLRLHGPYISEQESARLASFLRKQGRPIFNTAITADDKKEGPDGVEYERDDLYDEAARLVVQSGQASISHLQRKFRIGFSRAARLVDMMEAEGLVSAADGSKAREVTVPRNYFDEVDAQLR